MPVAYADITNLTMSETSGLDDRGYSVAMTRASFKVKGQGPYYCEMPKREYTADAMDRLIQEYASQIVMLRDRYPGA